MVTPLQPASKEELRVAADFMYVVRRFSFRQRNDSFET